MFTISIENKMKLEDQIQLVKNYLQSNQMNEAGQLLENLIKENDPNEELYFWLGKVCYKKQEWGNAINAFQKVLDLNPEHKDAQSQIDMAYNILGYFNPDMFNP